MRRRCHIARQQTFKEIMDMAAPSIAAEIVEEVAKELLRDTSVTDVCRKFKISRPTVTAIKKGEHKCLSAITRGKLTSGKKVVPQTKVQRQQRKTGSRQDNTLQLAQENLRLRNLLFEVMEKVTQTVREIGKQQACA